MFRRRNNHPEKIDEIYFLKEVPIQTLYIRCIPYTLNVTNLNDYFSKFGEIDSLITGYRKFERKRNRYGLIIFKYPESATRLIELGERHIVSNNIVSIKVAKIWDQPNYNKQKNARIEPENKQASKITLLDLNDDCLLHILSYLPIEDQVSFSFICERFRSVRQAVFKRIKRLNLTKLYSISPLNADKILSAIGIYIKEIVFQCYFPESNIKTLNAVWQKCKNIETLYLIDLISITNCTYSNMFFALKNLKSLSLINCHINDDTCKILQNCNEIESLNLSINNDISGAYLDKLTNLKKLNVSYTNTDSQYLILICQNAKLKELDILGCHNITENDLKRLFIYLTDLENLKISTLVTVDALTNELIKLKSLKHLKVDCRHYESGDHLGEIKNLECLPLEYFTIYNCVFDIKRRNDIMFLKHLNCLSIPEASGIDDCFLTDLAKAAPIRKLDLFYVSTITSKGLINFIEKCPTIEEIDISFAVCFVDNDFLLKIIDKMLEIKRIKTLKLIFDLTLISIENEEKYVQNKNLLKLCNNTTIFNAYMRFDHDYSSDDPYDNYYLDDVDYIDSSDFSDDN